MKFLRLTIVGDRFQVIEACTNRGIPAIIKFEDNNKACDVAINVTFEDLATAWQKEIPQEPPYPIGTLLCVQS